jgi:chromosomal replication initiation ATPase DnaA
MFVAAYRSTETGISQRGIERREDEAARRKAIERNRYLAEMDRLARIEERQQEALARTQAARALREKEGIRFRRGYAEIEATALRIFKLKRSELRSDRRNREVAFARQFVMYWTARLTPLSLPVIGRLMGGRDHTTVLHGKRAYVQKRAYQGRTLKEAR